LIHIGLFLHGRDGSADSVERRSRTRSLDARGNSRKLERKDTFVLDDAGEDVMRQAQRMATADFKRKEEMFSGTVHASGIRAMLERANQKFVFPPEVSLFLAL